jgi:trimeric autotransporter adhesin
MKLFIQTALVVCTTTVVYSQANTHLSNLVAPTAVNVPLLPNSTNARDLGSSSYSWRNVYANGSFYLDGGRFLSNAPRTSSFNTFVGTNSGFSITSGFNNTGLGYHALYKITTGYANTALGRSALTNNTAGYSNVAVGAQSLYTNSAGYWNIALGDSALYNNTIGHNNTVAGINALYSNTTGFSNTSLGDFTLYSNTTGSDNNAIGDATLFNNTTGAINNALGSFALYHNTTGSGNTALGQDALFGNTTGNNNTGVGYDAGIFFTSQGTFVGAEAGSISGLTNVMALGYNAFVDVSNRVRIGNTEVTSIGGQVSWTTFSDGRYKQNIKEDVHGLDFINSLRPITYTVNIKALNAHNTGRAQRPVNSGTALQTNDAKAESEATQVVYNGFIAQEVEEAAKKINYDFSGVDKPKNMDGLYGLRYSDFVVPLVKAVQELDSVNKKLTQENKNIKEQMAELRQMVLELKNGSTNKVTSISASLEQNTPNPANGTTTIRYHIPETVTSVVLNITNVKGQLVKTMTLISGSGQVNLNTSMLAAGTYNYTLYVDGKQVDTKRLVIAR